MGLEFSDSRGGIQLVLELLLLASGRHNEDTLNIYIKKFDA